MNSVLKPIVACLLMLGAQSAFSADTVFGVPLGQPLVVPECPKSRADHYEFMPDRLCFQHRFLGAVTTTDTSQPYSVILLFPHSEWPKVLRGRKPTLHIIAGNVEGISFETSGIDDQDEVLAALKAKYGEPLVLDPQTVQNRMGASFNVFTAAWATETITVSYASTAGRVDSGLVKIQTLKAEAYEKRAQQQSDAARRSL